MVNDLKFYVQLLARTPLLKCNLSYDKSSILLLISAQLTVKTCLQAPMSHLFTIVYEITMAGVLIWLA